MKTFRHDFIFFVSLVVIAIAIGLGINALRKNSLPLNYLSKTERIERSVEQIKKDTSPNLQQPLPETLSLQEFAEFVKNRAGIVLDARYRIEHQLAHIPSALSLPRDEFVDGYASLKTVLEKDRTQPIVVYCDGADCEDSLLVQKGLASLGYTQVAIFKGGWSEWTNAHMPKEANR